MRKLSPTPTVIILSDIREHMADSVTVTVDLVNFTFSTSTTTKNNLTIDSQNNIFSLTVTNGAITASAQFPVSVSPGLHNFTLVIQISTATSSIISPTPANGATIGTGTIKFNDTPSTEFSVPLVVQRGVASGSVNNQLINCLHGSSLVAAREGPKKLREIRNGDEVISGYNLNEYAKVKCVAQCWIKHPGPDHDAVIFEPNSLGPNEPSERLIIDPGHPISLQSDYLKYGIASLRPAASFLPSEPSDKIYVRKWIDELVQQEPSVRYDLLLEEPYSVYLANNIVVKGLISQTEYGYSHGYGNLI